MKIIAFKKDMKDTVLKKAEKMEKEQG